MLYCLSQTKSELAWKYDCLSEIYSSPFSFANSSKIVCVSSDGLLNIFDLEGNLIKRKKIIDMNESFFSSPVVFRDKIYIGARDNFLYCID